MQSQQNGTDQGSEIFNATLTHVESKHHVRWTPMTVFIAAFLALLILVTTIGNLVLCRLVWVCRRMRIPSFCFVASMSFSDFLMGLLVIPISLGYHITYQTTGKWIFGHFTCNLWLFFNFILCSASVYNLCVVSGDRYIAVTSPLKYLSRMSEHRVKRIIAISWLCAVALAGFVTYGTNASKDNAKNCSVWGLRYEFSITVLIAAYIIPVSFLVFVNGKVFLIAHFHMNRIHAQEMSLASVSRYAEAASTASRQGTAECNQGFSRRRMKQEIKIFKTFLIVTCAFLFCWTPFIVVLLIDSIFNIPSIIRHSSIILLYCNSALNPFIYGYFNAEFRKALRESFGCKRNCLKP